MIRLAAFFTVALLFFSSDLIGQFLIPGDGIMGVKVGADQDETEWELGFKGKKIEYQNSDEKIRNIASKIGIQFDYMIKYNHVMWLPVSELLFKDGKVCLVQLSSYPEYNQMLSSDIGTIDGLNFWDTEEALSKIYRNYQSFSSDERKIVIIKNRGLGVELHENEVRSMFIFEPK